MIRVLVAEEALEDFTVVAAGRGTEEVIGRTISLSILPSWKRDRLKSHRSYEVPTYEAELAQPPDSIGPF